MANAFIVEPNGTIHILDESDLIDKYKTKDYMDSFYITDVVDILVETFGNNETKINTIGTREGEKMHELLISPQELGRTTLIDNTYFSITPQIDTGRQWNNVGKKITHTLSSYTNLQDRDTLYKLLIKSKLI